MDISSSVTSIEKHTFEDCGSLTAVKIPSSVTSIGDNAFENCYRLTSVDIPPSVTSIGDYAFDGCPLDSLIIPGDSISLGDHCITSGWCPTYILASNITASLWAFPFIDKLYILNPQATIKGIDGEINFSGITVYGTQQVLYQIRGAYSKKELYTFVFS